MCREYGSEGAVRQRKYSLAQSNIIALLNHTLATIPYDLAEQEIRKALNLSAEEPRYFGLLALIYQARGQLRLAEDAYRSALKADKVPPCYFAQLQHCLTPSRSCR